jgi:lauroyl/myristoyl acyltransferase
VAKILSAQDATVLLSIPILSTIAWSVPERNWLQLCRRLGRFAIPALTDDPDSLLQRMRQTLGENAIVLSPETILSELAAEQILARLQLLKDYRPGGWKPVIHLVGREYIEAALQNGHGVILWVGYFVGSELVTKIALHQAGFAVHHLSRASHGFSSTRFGLRYLNRIQTAIEERYLAKRIVLSADNPTQAMLSLAYQLRQNQIVSITAHRNSKTPTKVKFLDGYMYLAPGAPLLAHQTKAALLPVLPLRDENGNLTVIVEAPLQVSSDRSDRKVMERTAQQYATVLEPYVLKFPGQWLGWLHL